MILKKLRLAFLFGWPLAPLVALAALSGQAAEKKQASSPPIQFNRDVRPILSENCVFCHGPDKNQRQAGLRLDVRAAAIEKGAIVPGKPGQSALIARVFSTDKDLLMPPASAHKTLKPAQKETLRRWIAEGAPYQSHWAYIAPKRPAVPVVAAVRGNPVRNPIDAFIRARLAQEKITPSPEADRRTLIRRVSLDLTGLPPTPEEVRAFLADTSPTAYEKLVDRLLKSPHYGERMAVPWLDVVRYADTVGFHGDQNQNAWAYRDYVIDSFNRNKPFDRFTIEQIAGDLLPKATPEQKTATGFNRLNMVTREGGAQPKEYLSKYAADRARTVSMAFLGSTMGCAECHDHKYDPFSQRDFYTMQAYFADVKQWGVYADYGYTPNPDLRGYNNDYPFPPEIEVESRYLKERIARQRQRIAALAVESGAAFVTDGNAKSAFDAWRRAGTAFLTKHPDGWESPATPVVQVTSAAPPAPKKTPAPSGADKPAAAASPKFRVEPNGSVLLESATPATVMIGVRPQQAGWIAALRVEALPHAANGNTVFRQGLTAATLTLSAAVQRAAAGGAKPEPAPFRFAGAAFAEPRYANGFAMLGVHRGWKLSTAHKTRPQESVWLLDKPVRVAAGDTLTVTLPNLGAGCVRVSVSPFAPENPNRATLPPALRTALAEPNASLAAEAAALRAYLFGTGWNAAAFAKGKALEADIFACRDGKTPTMVTESTKPLVTRVLPRGDWQNETGEIVQPMPPGFLPQPKPVPGRRATRLDLAKWLVSPENPLTARVFVNRLWKQFYGNGLSGQVEDLGAQGEWPTHPELLDWLAVEFRESGWDIKRLARLMVTSAAYRQSSKLRPELRDRDPNNRLLASQNPRRLDAEFIRDNALVVAGLLNRDRGGPPVKPYQPPGYYVNIQFPNRDYVADADDRQYRRGVYTHWQRTFPHPMLINFDAPSREDCIAARNAANTPQQALTLLNDPSFVEAARVLAARVLSAPGAGTDEARMENAYQRALARPMKPKEKQSLLTFLKTMRAAYKERPEDAKKLLTVGLTPAPQDADPIEIAAWTSVCRVILNLQETITRY